MTTTLQMEFEMEDGKALTVSLSEPKSDLGADEVTAWADQVIAKQAILSGDSFPKALKSAQIKRVEYQPLV